MAPPRPARRHRVPEITLPGYRSCFMKLLSYRTALVDMMHWLLDMPRRNWKALSLITICLFLAAYSFGLVYEGFIADRYTGVFTFPFVDEAGAERAYHSVRQDASLAEREAAARRLVEADPTNPDSWNAVSYAEFLKAGRMSPEALMALDHSYTVGIFGRAGGVWRISYALENWSLLSQSLRSEVIAEAQTALTDPVEGPSLRARLQQVHNPEGRLATVLILAK